MVSTPAGDHMGVVSREFEILANNRDVAASAEKTARAHLRQLAESLRTQADSASLDQLSLTLREVEEAVGRVQRFGALCLALEADDPVAALSDFATTCQDEVLSAAAVGISGKIQRNRGSVGDLLPGETADHRIDRDEFYRRLDEMNSQVDAAGARWRARDYIPDLGQVPAEVRETLGALADAQHLTVNDQVMGEKFMFAFESLLRVGHARGWLTATEAITGQRRR